MVKVTDQSLIDQLNAQQQNQVAPTPETPPGQTMVNDPELVKQLNQRKADLSDDSWGAYFSDLAFSMRGLGYGVGDEIVGAAGGDVDAYKQREELARLRSPVCLLYTSPSPRDS